MTVTTYSNLKRDYLLSLLILLIGGCQAQDSDSMASLVGGFFAIPISLFVIIASIMCACFWICYCRHRKLQRRNYAPPVTTQYTPYNPEGPYHGGNQPYPVQGYIVPSTGSNPPPTQAYPGQVYIPLSTVPFAPPAETTSQTVLKASEPVPLPEATLHQGDAPPAYDKAIKMKIVTIVDQDK